MTACALALVVALTACGKQASTTHGAAPVALVVAAEQAPAAGKATVLGALNDVDWYLVVNSQNKSKKPLVIWTESKLACEQDVAEFSLKAVNPASTTEPAQAWCMVGKDVRTKLAL